MVCQLSLREMLALSQTCRTLRCLVQTGIQPASWAAAAGSSVTFQPGASSTACYQRLQRLAASHAALRAGQPRAVTSLPWQDAHGRLHSRQPWCGEARLGAVPDSSGKRVVSLQADSTQLHELGPDLQLHLLFSLPSPETSPTAEEREVAACWAHDSSKLALVFTVCDWDGQPALATNAWSTDVYLVRLAAQTGHAASLCRV